jgi:hypothetical protein
MSISTNKGSVDHIFVDGKGYVTEVRKEDGTIIWEEYVGKFAVAAADVKATNKSGIDRSAGVLKVTCKRSSTNEPTATEGTLEYGAKLYNGDELSSFAVQAASRYSVISGPDPITLTVASADIYDTNRENDVSASIKCQLSYTMPTYLTEPSFSGGYDYYEDESKVFVINKNDVDVICHYGRSSSTMNQKITVGANSTEEILSVSGSAAISASAYFTYSYFDTYIGTQRSLTSSTNSL